MSIIRSKRASKFTVIGNHIFESGLSWKAVGILAYLLSKPDDWSVSVAQLVKHTKKTKSPLGRDGVYSVLGELKSAGYVETKEVRNENGTFVGTDYMVSDEPLTASPDTAQPFTANPTLINTDPLISTESKQTSTSQAKRDKFADQVSEVFNHWKETMGKDSRAKLNKKRESAIRARLKDGFTVDEICLAITGCAKSAFHMGQNDEGKVYDDLALICRDDGKLNMFMKMKEKPAKTGGQDKAGFYQQLASKRFYDE